MARDTWANVLIALLLSVPVGVGVTLATLKVTGGDYTNPLVPVSGIVITVVLFLIVVAGFAVGSEDPDFGR